MSKGSAQKFRKTIANLEKQEFLTGSDIIKDIEEGNYSAFIAEEHRKNSANSKKERQDYLLQQQKKALVLDLLLEFLTKQLGKDLDDLIKSIK